MQCPHGIVNLGINVLKGRRDQSQSHYARQYYLNAEHYQSMESYVFYLNYF